MLAWHRILILLLTRCGVPSQDCQVQQAAQGQAGAVVPRRGAAYTGISTEQSATRRHRQKCSKNQGPAICREAHLHV